MEREQEIAKLVNVLHRVARAAVYSSWVRTEKDAVRFCVAQYNKVLARLKELEPAIASLYVGLAEDASPEVLRMAAQDVAAYFEDETGVRKSRHARKHCGPRPVVFAAWPHMGRRCG